MMGFLKFVQDFCYPPLCYLCGNFLAEHGLCANCWGRIKWISAPYCNVCGRPFDIAMHQTCADCLHKMPHFDHVVSVCCYNEISRNMIIRFKYADDTYLTQLFAKWMIRAGGEILSSADMLIPVPMTLLKRLKRKYNQAELLAMEISKHAKILYQPELLYKSKNTSPQESLTKKQREKNLKNVFSIKEEYAVQGKNIVLIDDVMTTGSTINECAKILKIHGAKTVCAITIATVV